MLLMTIIADDDVDDVEVLMPPSEVVVDVALSMRHIILFFGGVVSCNVMQKWSKVRKKEGRRRVVRAKDEGQREERKHAHHFFESAARCSSAQ